MIHWDKRFLLLRAGARVGEAQKDSLFYEQALHMQTVYEKMSLNSLLDQAKLSNGTSSHFANRSYKKANPLDEKTQKFALENAKPLQNAEDEIARLKRIVRENPKALIETIREQDISDLQESLYNIIQGLDDRNEEKVELYKDYIRYVFVSGRIDFQKNFDTPPNATNDSPLTAIIEFERSDTLQADLFKAGVRVTSAQSRSSTYKKAVFREEFCKGWCRIRG